MTTPAATTPSPDLPADLLVTILRRLPFYEDLQSAASVSRHWRSAANRSNFHPSPSQLPYLLLLSSSSSSPRRFFSLSNSKLCHVTLPVPTTETLTLPSSLGWLLAVTKNLSLSLLNPFSGSTIPLPDRSSLIELDQYERLDKYDRLDRFEIDNNFKGFVEKFAVSSSPGVGDEGFFVGCNSSISIDVSGSHGCKPNCVYFTDDWSDSWGCNDVGGRDMGIYNLADGNIEPLYEGEFSTDVAPPLWVVPGH